MELYVYGTGCGAGDLIDGGLSPEKVTAFVESDPSRESFLGRPVISVRELAERDYDLILITSRQADEVSERCSALGIDPEKLFFLKNNYYPADRNTDYELASAVLGKDLASLLHGSHKMIRVPLWASGPDGEDDADYVRVKTLEAICSRLDGIPGAVAELGVFRGEFARHLNALLPDRHLYLFDTFTGFDPSEAAGQSESFVAAHTGTSEDLVLSRMPHPEKAEIRKGMFPFSAAGLDDERFALVSLDVDLEESTFAGLGWFLPRLSPGGFLLLHDYNSPDLPGVKRAVERYEERSGRLKAVPLCDVNGTLVVCG